MSPSLHLHPINVVVYNDPEKSNLVAGFVLRCFQHLSDPDLDTRQCTVLDRPLVYRLCRQVHCRVSKSGLDKC